MFVDDLGQIRSSPVYSRNVFECYRHGITKPSPPKEKTTATSTTTVLNSLAATGDIISILYNSVIIIILLPDPPGNEFPSIRSSSTFLR